MSKITDAADSGLAIEGPRIEVSISEGTVTLADQLSNQELIEAIKKSLPLAPPLELASQHQLSFPGFESHFITLSRNRLRSISLAPDRRIWRIESSLLIPALILMLGAAFSFLEYRKARNTMALDKKPATGSEAAAHPLD